MSTYNRPEMLDRAIKSFLKQDYPDCNLIILNNGSGPRTAEVLSNYPDIKVFTASENTSPPYNWLYLWDKAKGDLICQLHDDDELTTDSISKRVALFKSNTDLEVVYGGWITGDNIYSGKAPDKERILREDYINFTTLMYRSGLKFRFDPDMEHYFDWLFKIRCVHECRTGFTPDPVMIYNIHLGQESVKCKQLGLSQKEESIMRKKVFELYGIR